MRAWAKRLRAIAPVSTFDYPYMLEGRRRPDRLPALIDAHRAALRRARKAGGAPVVLAGKSMGSRVGCHLALEEPGIPALVCFGYPLVSPGPKKTRRDQVLLALEVPVLFVQGTRDRLCPLDELDAVRARMKTRSELHVVESGDHSLGVTTKHDQTVANDAIVEAVRAFLTGAIG